MIGIGTGIASIFSSAFLGKIKNNMFGIIVFIIAIILSFLYIRSEIKNKERIAILTHNYKVEKDRIETYYNEELKTEVSKRQAVYVDLGSKVTQKDAESKRQQREINALGIKNKNLKAIVEVQMDIVDSLKGVIYKIPIYNIDSIGDTVSVNYVERDTATIQTLTIYRTRYSWEDTSRYKINYSPKLSAYASREKEGKWKLVNLFKWRRKYDVIRIFSNDSILKTTEIKYYLDTK